MLFAIGSLIDESTSLQGLIKGTLLLRVQVCIVFNNSYFPGSLFKSALTGEKPHKQRVCARQRERGIEIEKTEKKRTIRKNKRWKRGTGKCELDLERGSEVRRGREKEQESERKQKRGRGSVISLRISVQYLR